MSVVNYTEALKIIQDGDIVFVHGSFVNPVQAAIMFFTGSRFCHCFIAFREQVCGNEVLLCVEAQGRTRRRVVPVSLYQNTTLTVVAAPKQWEHVKDIALRDIGVAKYNMLRAIYLGVSEYCKRRFNFSLPSLPRSHEVCSDFCADVYDIKETGSPQVFYDQLMEITQERKELTL